MLLGERGSFYVGERPDQMYVEFQRPGPGILEHATPIVLYHGRSVSGAVHWQHRQGEQSFALYLVAHGWPVYVVDCPSHGRSPFRRRFGEAGLDTFPPSGLALLDRIGRSVVITTDMSAHVGWQLAQAQPDLVAAVASWRPAVPGAPVAPAGGPSAGGPGWSEGIVFPDAAAARAHAVPESATMLRELVAPPAIGPMPASVPALVAADDVRNDADDPYEPYAASLPADYRRLGCVPDAEQPLGTIPLLFADVLFLWLAATAWGKESADDPR